MARPKTGKPPKKNLTLTVDELTREQLELLSQYRQQSISSMVAEWAEEEVKKVMQNNYRQAMNDQYMNAIKTTIASGKADEILRSPKAQASLNTVVLQREEKE